MKETEDMLLKEIRYLRKRAEKSEDRSYELERVIREVRQMLRSTQLNWHEQALFDADAILTKALGE